jgi:hypothetical protein
MAARIAEESVVFTDSAAVYKGIGDKQSLGFVHMAVNHRRQFVRHVLFRGQVYTVHTNGVERLWGLTKKFIKSFNSPTYLDAQVDWAIYNRNFLKGLKKGSAFNKFLKDATWHFGGPSRIYSGTFQLFVF